MAMYKISHEKLELIKTVPVSLEKEIQQLTEQNLELIFALEFISSEFALQNFRIDSLAFDLEINAFVIIEYKKKRTFSVIDQGYAYLSLLLNNKADFILEYNERKGKSLKKQDVDWSQSRIMFISPSFTTYQRESINFKDLPIELWEVKKYANNIITYTPIRPATTTESIKTISKGNQAMTHVSQEVLVYSQDSVLASSSFLIQEMYAAIREEIYQIDDSIEEKITKTMFGYYSGGKGLIWIQPSKNRLTIHLRKGNYRDIRKKIKPKGWGDYPEVVFSEQDVDIDYIRDLIQQAYEIPV